jgi:epoxide hydrolase-like predicted phosphatase
MIKAVIFDCFGVLTTEGFGVFRAKYFQDQPEKREKANRLMDELNAGRLDYQGFLDNLSRLSGAAKPEIIEYLTHNRSNEPLFGIIRTELKPRFKISMLSNAGDNWLEEMFSKDDLALFDDILLSYEVGFIKPQSEFYQLAAERLKLKPQECLFIDDSTGHCAGADKVGMKTIHYKNFDQVREDLQKALSAGSNN